MVKINDGLANKGNLKDWASYSRSNSFHADRLQSRHDLSGEGAAKDAKGSWSDDWRQPQKKSEGRGWAKMDDVTASHTYTGKGGSKRD